MAGEKSQCSECGAELLPSMVYCSSCGQKCANNFQPLTNKELTNIASRKILETNFTKIYIQLLHRTFYTFYLITSFFFLISIFEDYFPFDWVFFLILTGLFNHLFEKLPEYDQSARILLIIFLVALIVISSIIAMQYIPYLWVLVVIWVLVLLPMLLHQPTKAQFESDKIDHSDFFNF